MKKKLFPQEIEIYIKTNFVEMTDKQLSYAIEKQHGKEYTEKQIKRFREYNGYVMSKNKQEKESAEPQHFQRLTVEGRITTHRCIG